MPSVQPRFKARSGLVADAKFAWTFRSTPCSALATTALRVGHVLRCCGAVANPCALYAGAESKESTLVFLTTLTFGDEIIDRRAVTESMSPGVWGCLLLLC